MFMGITLDKYDPVYPAGLISAYLEAKLGFVENSTNDNIFTLYTLIEIHVLNRCLCTIC